MGKSRRAWGQNETSEEAGAEPFGCGEQGMQVQGDWEGRARWHGAAGEQEDRTCSGAQASSRDWRASEGSAGRGGNLGRLGCDKSAHWQRSARREQQQERKTVTGRTKSAAGGGQAVEQQPDAV